MSSSKGNSAYKSGWASTGNQGTPVQPRAKAPQLDEFDPAQFDIDFSSASSKNSQPPTPKEKENHREDKKLVEQFGAIAGLMKRIDNQLANKDKLLNSTANTPAAGIKNQPKNWLLQFATPNQPQKSQLAPINENDTRNSGVNPKQRNPSPFASILAPANQEGRNRPSERDQRGAGPQAGAPDSRPSTQRDRDRQDSDRNLPSSDRSRSRDPSQSGVSGSKDYKVPAMHNKVESSSFDLPFKEDQPAYDPLYPSGKKPSADNPRKNRDDLDDLKYKGPSNRKSTDTYIPRETPLQSQVFSRGPDHKSKSAVDDDHQPRFFDEARQRYADKQKPSAVARNNFKDDDDLMPEELPDYGDFDNMSFSDMPTKKGKDRTPGMSQAPKDSQALDSRKPTRPARDNPGRTPAANNQSRRDKDQGVDQIRFDSEEDSTPSGNKSRDRSKGPDSSRDPLNQSGKPGSDKVHSDKQGGDPAAAVRQSNDKLSSKDRPKNSSNTLRPDAGNSETHADESKQKPKSSSRQSNDPDRQRKPSDKDMKSSYYEGRTPSEGSVDKPARRDDKSPESASNRTKAPGESRTKESKKSAPKENTSDRRTENRDSRRNDPSARNTLDPKRSSRVEQRSESDSRDPSPNSVARREGPAAAEYRESRVEYKNKPKSKDSPGRELPPRIDVASLEQRESYMEYRKPSSREPSGRDLAPRTDAATQEYRESYYENRKPKSRDSSGRTLPPPSGAANQEKRESYVEYRKPSSREPSARDLPPRTDAATQEYRESHMEYRKPKSRESSARDMPPRTDAASQELRESQQNYRKPSSREPSGRDLPPRTEAANQEYRESYAEYRKPSSREPSAREMARREDARQEEARLSTFKHENRNSKFAEDNPEENPQGVAQRESGSKTETRTSTYYYKRPSRDNFDEDRKSSRKSSQNPDSHVADRDSRRSYDERDDSGRNRQGSKKHSYDVADELGDSHAREDSPSVQLIVPPKKPKQSLAKSDESSSIVQNLKVVEPEGSSRQEGTSKHQSQTNRTLLGVPKSMEQSKLVDPLVIPIFTYPKLKNFRKKGVELDEEEISQYEAEELAPEDLKLKEEIKAAERAQNIDEIIDLGSNIINDLETANGKQHPYVSNLTKLKSEVEANREILKQKDSPPGTEKKLEEFIEKLKKLDVKEQKYASKNEKNKLEGLMRRKSMQRILTENVGENPNIAGKSIVSPERTTEELSNYVVTFLKDYSDRVSSLNTPTSTAFADAANDTIELLPEVQKERPPTHHHELLRLLAHSIHRRFHDEAASPTLESPKTPSDIGVEDNNVVEFGHFLRSLNKLGQIPFKELDDMVSEPSCKINLFKMREELIEKKKVDPTKEKENDLTLLNSHKENKHALEELIINLGKEILPPLNFVENHTLDDSVPHVQFFDLKKQDSFNFGQGPTFVDNSGFDDDDFSFTPTTKKPEEPAENNKPPALGDLGGVKKQNKFNHIEPKVFESEDELDGFRPTSLISGTESDTTRRTKEDQEKNYRYDLVDEVEFQIEKVQDEQTVVKDIKEQIRDETKRPSSPDKVPTSLLDSVHANLDRVHEFEEYSQLHEPLYLELSEKLGSNAEPKGFLRVWPKYMRELARLKKNVSDMIKEMQKCAEGKMRESKIQVSKLEEAAEEAKEEAENIRPGANPDDLREFEERAKILQDEARRKEEETEKLDRIRKALAKATLALAPTNVEKQVEESAKKISITPAQAVRRLSKLEVAQKQTEQKEKKEELGETVEKLEDLINQYKIIEESSSPADTDRKGLTSSRRTFEEPPRPPAAPAIRPKKDSGSVRKSQKKQSDPEAIVRSMVLAEMAREEQRDPQEGPQEISVTKVVLQHTLQQMRALARAILSAIDSSKDFDTRKDRMTPLDRKSETEQTQNQYEFARNGLLSVLAKPETTLLLNQRENLPVLARSVKRECEKLVEISKEPENRETLQVATQEFYDALVPIKFDDQDEVEKIKDMIEGIKEEEKIKKEVDIMKEDLSKPKRDRTMAELIALIKDDIVKIEKLMKDPESKISPVEVKNMEKIAEEAKILLSHPIPPAESILQVKKFARGGSVLLPENQVDIPQNLDKNNDKLAEMMLKEKEYQMKKAAEELGKSFASKGIDLKKDDTKDASTLKDSYILAPGGKLAKSQHPEHPRAASALLESKLTFQGDNIQKALELPAPDKQTLQQQLETLKRAVEQCVETAEEELFSKAVGVEGLVYERKFEEASNPMLDRMEGKVKDLKSAVDRGDRQDVIGHLVRDIVQANQRDLENKMGDGALLSPRKQGEVADSLEKLEKSAQSYENIKKQIKETMLPLIKKTEVLLGLKMEENNEGVEPKLSVVIAPSEGQQSSAVISEYGSKEIPRSDAEYSNIPAGGSVEHHGDEQKTDTMRRNKKPRKIKEIAGLMEDDSREFFSYNIFSEGENPDQYDSQNLRPKMQQSSVEVHTDDKIDEESHHSSEARSYGDRDHYTEQDSREQRSYEPDYRREEEEQRYSRPRYGEEEQGRYEEQSYPSRSQSQREPTSQSHRSQNAAYSGRDEHKSKNSKKSDQQNQPQSDYPSFRKNPHESAKEEEYFSDIFKKDGPAQGESEGRYSEYFNSKKGDEEKQPKSNEFHSKGGRSESHRSEPVQKIQTHFVSPAKEVKPKRNKTYYVEDAVPNPGKKDKPLVPVLTPVVFPASTDSSESGPSDIESMESFYIERKKNGRRVYERKKRPLREGETRNEMKPVPGETMLSAVLQESSEWNRGKKVFKKQAALVDIRPPPQHEVREKKLDYFDVIGIDEETGERKVQQKETKVKSIKPTEEEIVKALDKGTRFAVMLGADKEYKIIKLNDLVENPLDLTEKLQQIPSGPTSNAFTGDQKLQGSVKTNNSAEPIVNVIEKLPLLFRDLPVLNEMRVKPVRPVSNIDGLQMFLRQLEAIPNAFVSVWEQTDDFILTKPVVSQLYKIPGAGAEKCNKILEGLAKDGKLSGVDPTEHSKVGPQAGTKTGAAGKLDRTTVSAKLGAKSNVPEQSLVIAPKPIEGLIVAPESGTAQEEAPIYILQENPDRNKQTGESDTTAAEDIHQRALEELGRALEKTAKIGDVGGLYARLAKEGVETHPTGQQQMDLVDELFRKVEAEAKRRGQPFDDCLFPPGAGSMVNNSLKSEQPYKDCDWCPLAEQFEVELY